MITEAGMADARTSPVAEVPVILNLRAGAAETRPTIEAISEQFRSCGLEPRIVVVKKLAELAAIRLAQSGNNLVVAAGGDGTVRAVASALVDTNTALGILPLGTFNHFARDLGIPMNLEGAVRLIAAGKVARVDVGEVNGEIFINNSSVGLYPNIVLVRRHEQRRGRRKWAAFVVATLRVLRNFPRMTIGLRAGGKEITQSTTFVFVGNNEYEVEGLNIGLRRRLTGGQLFCYLAHATTRAQLFRLLLAALFRRLRQSHGVDVVAGNEAWVASRRKHLRVALDGEVLVLAPPLHYHSRPAALRVIVP